MGQSKMRRLMVILMAMIMTMAMIVPSFAATTSPSEGGTAKTAVIKSVTTEAFYNSASIKVTYKASNATKYKVAYRVAGGKWKTFTTTKKGSCTIDGLTKGKLYQVKIAGINKAGKVGKYSAVKYRYLAKTSQKVKSPKAKQIKVTWNKVSSATGYVIYYSTKSDMSNYKTKTITGGSKTSATIKNLKKGKTYYVRIRPVKKYSGTTYKGVLTAKKSVKVK